MNDTDPDSGGKSIWDLLKEFEQSTSGGIDMSDIPFLVSFNPILCGIVIVLGSVGNIFNLYYFIVTDKINRFGKKILIGITVMDFITIINFPLNLFLKRVADISFRSFSNTSCRITAAMATLSINWSIALLEILALERFCAVVFPFKVKLICTKRTKFIMFCGVFLVVGSRVAMSYKSLKTSLECIVFAGPAASFSYFFDIVYAWQNSIVLIVSNSIILVTLMRRKIGQENSISQKSRQTVRLMLGLSCISVFFALPYQIFNVLMETDLYYQMPFKVHNRLYDLCLIIYYMNNGVNFLFYVINSADYRMRIFKLITAGKYDPGKSMKARTETQKPVSSVQTGKEDK